MQKPDDFARPLEKFPKTKTGGPFVHPFAPRTLTVNLKFRLFPPTFSEYQLAEGNHATFSKIIFGVFSATYNFLTPQTPLTTFFVTSVRNGRNGNDAVTRRHSLTRCRSSAPALLLQHAYSGTDRSTTFCTAEGFRSERDRYLEVRKPGELEARRQDEPPR